MTHYKSDKTFQKTVLPKIVAQLKANHPVIAHIHTAKVATHFVVITGIGAKDLIINDPAKSRAGTLAAR